MVVSLPQTRTHKLSELLAGLVQVEAANDRDIKGLSDDSRRIRAGDLFLACAGSKTHGTRFVEDAIGNGAVAIVYEAGSLSAGNEALLKVPAFAVTDLKQKTGVIASRFYGEPSRDLLVIGVTGTNGKTSCCHFLAQALNNEQSPCGVIGTLGYGLFGHLHAGQHTTPDAITLQSLLADFRAAGARYVVMEVSSHGLDQGRVAGVMFNAAILTNLSHEHLDYHDSFESYGKAKQQLFAAPGLQYAIVNHDDAFGREVLAALPKSLKVFAYALIDEIGDEGREGCDAGGWHVCIQGKIKKMDNNGLDMEVTLPVGKGQLNTGLLGRFNASNLLAVLSTLLLLDVTFDDALTRLSKVSTVPGRMERFGGAQGQPLVIVDFAHTPDALEQVLQTLREHCQGLLWCVFGCGGDRDKDKRALMGAIAEQYADHIIITDDNPRTESAAQIVSDILSGIKDQGKLEIQRDRSQAIANAINQAAAGDVVLIAGKGHEEFQIIGDQTIPFSDRSQVRSVLKDVA